MSYSVKEIYYTLQGEGAMSGQPAVFCRFAGCNLWSGHEEDRATAICPFCDTDFVGTDGPGGGVFDTAVALARAVEAKWPRAGAAAERLVVLTGGEPLLQVDEALVRALHGRGFRIAVETNGTLEAPAGLEKGRDWVCVSPKAGAELRLTDGDELKLVFPQPGAEPERYSALPFDRFSLQPMDGPDLEENRRLTMRYCLEHPQWSLSLQLHKVLGIP